jgi:hypothetical protein
MSFRNELPVTESIESTTQPNHRVDRRAERSRLPGRGLRVHTGIVAGDRVPKPRFAWDDSDSYFE